MNGVRHVIRDHPAPRRHIKVWVTAQGYRIRQFRSGNGKGEYSNKTFRRSLVIQKSPSNLHQHKSGVSERMIWILNTKARSMLLDAGLPEKFLADAIATAVYLHRRSPSNSLEGLTPYGLLTGQTQATSSPSLWMYGLQAHTKRSTQGQQIQRTLETVHTAGIRT